MGSQDADESLAAALIEEAPEAIFVVDATGLITLANRRAAELFGYAREELVGASIESLVPADLRARHRAMRDGYQEAPRARPMGAGLLLSAITKDGRTLAVEISLSPIRTKAGTFTIAIVHDVSARRAYEEELLRLGTEDTLTGLRNRAFFDAQRVHLATSRGSIGVLCLDVDGLKRANDSLGHEAGDELLKRTGRVLRASLRAHDLVARTGGDEFVALLEGVDDERLAQATARLREELACDNADAPLGATLSLSIGSALARSGAELGEALRAADVQMYIDKRARRAERPSDASASTSARPPAPDEDDA